MSLIGPILMLAASALYIFAAFLHNRTRKRVLARERERALLYAASCAQMDQLKAIWLKSLTADMGEADIERLRLMFDVPSPASTLN